MDVPTITEFYATWCVPCKAQDIELKRLEAFRPGLLVRRLNIEQHPDLVQKYEIKTVPFVMYQEPGKAPLGMPGLTSAEQLITKFGL